MAEENLLLEHDITLQQIQAFLVIAKYHSLSRAASEMYISQPALSRTLKRFEEGVGISLFVRSNQGVSLTDAGKTLYLAFKSLYDNLEQTIRWVKDRAPAQKLLHIAVPLNYDFSEDFGPLKDIIRKFEQKNPGVTVMESLFDLRQLSQSLDTGGIDIMLVPSCVADINQRNKRRQVSKFELSVAVAIDSPAQTLDNPRLFENLPVYAMSSSDFTGDLEYIRQLCLDLGFTPGKIEFPPNSQTLLHAVRRGKGVGVCWKFGYPGYDDNIRYLPIPHEKSRLYIDVRWNPNDVSPEAQSLINMLPEI